MKEHDEYEMVDDERDGSPEAYPSNVFREFVSRWKTLRPNGAVPNDTAVGQPQQRKLDVLTWGFGE